jgi:hypothetical protein
MNTQDPSKKKKVAPRMKGQVGESRVKVIEKHYEWGLYVYKKASGKWFTDGNGSILNIESMKGDILQISKLKEAAKHFGDEGDGTCVFVPGLTRISEEEYSEQKQRLEEGLIPSMNDLGAVQAAKDTIAKYGSDD